MSGSFRTTLVFALLLLSLVGNSAFANEREEFFEARIRPLLVSRCVECHGPLTQGRQAAPGSSGSSIEGRRIRSALIPGNAQDSLLYQAISQTHDTPAMPPDDSLSNDEIGAIRKWIDDGAVWPVSKIEFFQRNVFNTLNRSCIKCHDEQSKAGDLSLVSRERLLKGGPTGPAAIAGDSQNSLMIRLLAGTEESATDHSKFLNNKDQLTFAKWIDDGLHWRVPNASPEFVITEEHREFWSFQPVTPLHPGLSPESTNPLDHFIQKRIEQAKIQVAPPAKARTLIRRVYFDLLGLPPTEEQIVDFEEAFALDAKAAFANLVDSLLDLRIMENAGEDIGLT